MSVIGYLLLVSSLKSLTIVSSALVPSNSYAVQVLPLTEEDKWISFTTKPSGSQCPCLRLAVRLRGTQSLHTLSTSFPWLAALLCSCNLHTRATRIGPRVGLRLFFYVHGLIKYLKLLSWLHIGQKNNGRAPRAQNHRPNRVTPFKSREHPGLQRSPNDQEGAKPDGRILEQRHVSI